MAEPFELAPNPKPIETSPVVVEAEVNQKQIEEGKTSFTGTIIVHD